LRTACGRVHGAAPDTVALSMGEWWLRQYEQFGSTSIRRGMRAASPLLDSGTRAEEVRCQTGFSVCDGYVPPPDAGHPVPDPISASRLETLAACPYRYFLQTVLHLHPPHPWEADEERWLDPAQKGQAVHRILHLFMERLLAEDALPVHGGHGDLLEHIAVNVLDSLAARVPVPTTAARQETTRSIRDMLAVFLREESRSGGTPLALERAFGHAHADSNVLPALQLSLRDGALSVSGTVDRVDRMPDGSTLVRDYKTGRMRCDPRKGLDGGRVLQHALYVEAVHALLPDIAGAQPPRSEYFYLGEQAQGSRVRMPDARAVLPDVLGALRTLITTGVFPHSTRKSDCRNCDFTDLCGEAAVVTGQSAGKIADPENRMLEPCRRLQHD
ncbi:MAG: PD-(D/E)XK nuclease family protein, partial [Bacteroidota bacterium]|nr:PD-(D/E)XK nuclease family protein [Bacteroidota bacterium]